MEDPVQRLKCVHGEIGRTLQERVMEHRSAVDRIGFDIFGFAVWDWFW